MERLDYKEWPGTTELFPHDLLTLAPSVFIQGDNAYSVLDTIYSEFDSIINSGA